MKNATKGKILRALALALDVGVPLCVTLTQFPVWVDRSSGATVSGLCVLLLSLSCIPFYRQIKEYMKSPSAPVLWTVLFFLFVILENIAGEIKIVCFFGAVANAIGSAIYKIGTNILEKPD